METRPQLRMLRPHLCNLPIVALPAGCRLRTYRDGDAANWERIIGASFGGDPGRFSFERTMRSHPAFRPGRVFFIDVEDETVATASAWHAPQEMPEAGTVHYVGVLPGQQGRRLGYWVTLATLHRMAAEGWRRATLVTDDFRLPALRTYLRLGFEPLVVHENQRERWLAVLAQLGPEYSAERFATALAASVWVPGT